MGWKNITEDGLEKPYMLIGIKEYHKSMIYSKLEGILVSLIAIGLFKFLL